MDTSLAWVQQWRVDVHSPPCPICQKRPEPGSRGLSEDMGAMAVTQPQMTGKSKVNVALRAAGTRQGNHDTAILPCIYSNQPRAVLLTGSGTRPTATQLGHARESVLLPRPKNVSNDAVLLGQSRCLGP